MRRLIGKLILLTMDHGSQNFGPLFFFKASANNGHVLLFYQEDNDRPCSTIMVFLEYLGICTYMYTLSKQ